MDHPSSREAGSWLGSSNTELELALAEPVPFGAHKGKTLGYMRQHCPNYLAWLHHRLDTITKPSFRKALDVVWRHYWESMKRADEKAAADRRYLMR